MRSGRPSPRITRSVPVAKRGPDPRRNAGHLAFVRSLPCAICGSRPPSEACHIRAGTDGGLGVKPHDRWTVPMCSAHHREQHQRGEVEFFGSRGVDSHGLATRLWLKSGDQAAGERAVHRMAIEVMNRRAAG